MRTKFKLEWLTLLVALVLVWGFVPRLVAGESYSATRSAVGQTAAVANELALTVDAAQSKVNYTLVTTIHTVHGTFALKRGSIRVEPDGKASGEIVADATSGQSGDSSRDKKMHKDVLESAKFAEVVFRPDRVDGNFPASGPVSAQMHGKFVLHGSEHEVSVSVKGEINGDRWHGTATIKIPYVEWGLKSPSNFLLKAEPVVEVGLELVGTTGSH